MSVWKSRYEIVIDGRRVAVWEGASWTTGGAVELDGRVYQVRSNVWGRTYGMVDDKGTLIASADRVGGKNWTIEADGTTYQFHRASLWRQEEELHAGGLRVGSVKRKSIWRSDAVADLPGLPVAVAVFVVSVVLAHWDSYMVAAPAG